MTRVVMRIRTYLVAYSKCIFSRSAIEISKYSWKLVERVIPSILAAALSDELRSTKFATSALSLIQNFGFDGIGIDWKYPNRT